MRNNTIVNIQQSLKEKGFDAGTADGIWGRQTISALKAFQHRAGLIADGIFGPQTSGALFAGQEAAAPVPLLPWLGEAMHLIATREFLGPRSNPIIVDWAVDLDIPYKDDDIPWCGLFVGHCIAATLPEEVLPDNLLAARRWGRFGEKSEPRPGAIMVFWRDGKNSGKGHVGFYVAQNAAGDKYKILGGNQNNQVGYAWVSKNNFIEARWPRTATSLTGNLALVTADETAEINPNFA